MKMNRKVKRCVDCEKIYAVCACNQDKEAKKGRLMQAALDRGFSDGMRQRGGGKE